jgi:hypothetical protein
MTEFDLDGLDGANPLAFLAAIGTLRTADRCWPNAAARLRWELTGAGWRARLALDADIDVLSWLEGIAGHLREPEPALALADDLNLPCEAFRGALLAASGSADSHARNGVDFLAAFGSEAVQAQVNGKPNGLMADTALRTMSGAGHQHFLGFMRELTGSTDASHLEGALFTPWRYGDAGPSLRWDPADDRRYALRWKEPSGDPIRTVRGANRLAVEALPLLPTAPVGINLETTGFRRRRGEGVAFTWPVWTAPVRVDTVRSLLSFAELQKDAPDARSLAAMTIAELYRAQRLTLGKYRNFSQAVPVMAG